MSGSAPLWEWDGDYAIHFAIGAVATAGVMVGLHFTPVPAWLGTFMVPIAFGFGYWREIRQHEPDPLTPHQHAEALLWGIGGLLAAGVGLPLLL